MNDVAAAADERANYAGFWRRLAAFAIDYVVVLVVSAVLGAVAQLARLVDDSAPQLSLVALAGYFLYCTLLESSNWQATVGKRALGLKVTDARGERIGFVRAAVRFTTKLLSALTLLVGFLLIAVTRRRQGLHDLVAGTLVAHDGTPRRPAWIVAALSAVACVPVLAVLAAIALPAYQDFTIRAQVAEGLDIAASYRGAVESAWLERPREFADLSTESVASGGQGVGRYVESVEVVSGMIVITYGGAANRALAGSVLTLVPALNAQNAIAWVCGFGDPPPGFETVFEGHAGYTDIDPRFVPSSCRSSEP